MEESYNFSPGPAMWPREVMLKAKEEFLDFHYKVPHGMSALEISHRDPVFIDLLNTVNQKLTRLLNIPDNYKILWTTGGATLQFDNIVLNLLLNASSHPNNNSDNNYRADYFITGYWSQKAAAAANKYININKIINNPKATSLNDINNLNANNNQDYLNNLLYIYYTHNETISGLSFQNSLKHNGVINNYYNNQFNSIPGSIPIISDMTSCLLSEPLDVSQYGIILAAAQKNLGPSGITLVIIRDDLLSDNLLDNNNFLPNICNYRLISDGNSLLNTLPTYNIYFINLVLDWLQEQGGLDKISKINAVKAQKLYGFIDNSSIFSNIIDPEYRSLMNVTFDLDYNQFNKKVKNIEYYRSLFLQEATRNKLFNLEGHRSFGGMRASIYNSMPMAGIDRLISFMQDFENKIN